jgi:hypothetical protein
MAGLASVHSKSSPELKMKATSKKPRANMALPKSAMSKVKTAQAASPIGTNSSVNGKAVKTHKSAKFLLGPDDEPAATYAPVFGRTSYPLRLRVPVSKDLDLYTSQPGWGGVFHSNGAPEFNISSRYLVGLTIKDWLTESCSEFTTALSDVRSLHISGQWITRPSKFGVVSTPFVEWDEDTFLNTIGQQDLETNPNTHQDGDAMDKFLTIRYIKGLLVRLQCLDSLMYASLECRSCSSSAD